MGFFGVSNGEKWTPPAGATFREATPRENRLYYEYHAQHGCDGG